MSTHKVTLPEASPEALAVSAELAQVICQEIHQNGGWIPFERYMNLALYADGLGYYAAGSLKFGAAGDFTTAPELTPIFGQTLAHQLAELLPQTAGNIYEFGAGTGRLALDILQALQTLNRLPEHYFIIDLSAELIDRQRQTFVQHAPELLEKVTWLTQLPDQFDGILLGNEVLDAMPCSVVKWQNGAWQTCGVTFENERFVWQERPYLGDATYLAAAPQLDGYTTELNLQSLAFLNTLAERLTRGAMIWIDYGYGEREYFHPQRHMGTLIGHYRHHTIHDPFYLVGLMDLTSHVNFSHVADALIASGLDFIGYTSQANFLLNAGLGDVLETLDTSAPDFYVTSRAVQKLMSPAEMGELFKVIGFGRSVSYEWCGFSAGEMQHLL
ncbi:MAG: SAM-dependent methyltransferase [Neisseriaceae bacterium]|nr:SAM-dependent methyltransferase [Neisseriaceae bacterium]